MSSRTAGSSSSPPTRSAEGGAPADRAIGRLPTNGPWVGFRPDPGGYRLVFGLPGGLVVEDPTRDPAAVRAGLVAAAIAFFLATLDEPPLEHEATQADVAGLVTSLTTASQTGDDAVAREALDAIDDGLPADAVALRLQRLLPPGADALMILRDRLAAVS